MLSTLKMAKFGAYATATLCDYF